MSKVMKDTGTASWPLRLRAIASRLGKQGRDSWNVAISHPIPKGDPEGRPLRPRPTKAPGPQPCRARAPGHGCLGASPGASEK